jgi:hypothetical protein
MKKKVIKLIRILGIGLTEVLMDIKFDEIQFDSIEWVQSENKIFLHMFDKDMDFAFDFDELSKENKRKVYMQLANIVYN